MQPLLADEYLRKFLWKGSIPDASPEEEERVRQHTQSIIERNKQNKAYTAAIHSDALFLLKTIPRWQYDRDGVVSMAQMIHTLSRTASEISGEPVPDKIKAVVDALRDQGMLICEQIAVLMGCPMDHPSLRGRV